MAARNWLREYDRAVQADLRAGVIRPAESAEHRRHPRLEVPGVAVWVGVESGLDLISLEPGLAHLYSRKDLPLGHRLTLRVDDSAALDLEVEACRMEEADPTTLEVLYRVEARVLVSQTREMAGL